MAPLPHYLPYSVPYNYWRTCTGDLSLHERPKGLIIVILSTLTSFHLLKPSRWPVPDGRYRGDGHWPYDECKWPDERDKATYSK